MHKGYSLLLCATVLAAAGCPTVDLGDNPPDPGQCRPDMAYFETVIWSEFIDTGDPATSCVDTAGCHRDSDGRSAFRVVLPPTDQPVDFRANYARVVPFLNCGAPEASVLLAKPLRGVSTHAGGDPVQPGSDEERIFLEWFSQ